MSSQYFSGRVQSVVFSNEGNAYYIVRMILDQDEDGTGMFMEHLTATVVKGNVPGIQVQNGTWFGFEARWITHPQYGKQLNITRAPVLKDGWDATTAARMLVANGVGGAVMLSIRNHYADDVLIDALEDAERLEEVPGLAKFSAMHVASRWKMVKAYFKTLDFLTNLGLPAGLVSTIWSYFGDDANDVLSNNPWRLVEVDGIEFKHADEAARRLGLVNETFQIEGAVLYACKNGRGFGHLYLQTGAVFHSVRAMVPGTEKVVIAHALAALHKRGLLFIDKKTRPGVTAVYEPWSYQMEVDGARLLIERVKKAVFLPGEKRTEKYLKDLGSVGALTEAAVKSGRKKGRLERVVRVAIDEWGGAAQLVLSTSQKEGIFNALTAPVSILAGLPGTGKTTSLRAAVRILQDASVPFLLCAPTGIAAKNLSALTGASASTIHRAFSAKGQSDNRRAHTYVGVTGNASRSVVGGVGDEGWGYSQDNPHPADVIILDEASMLDQHLIFRLLDCTKPDARLVLVGDYEQLPSVGPGNVLRDLIHSKMFPTIKLTEIFRQDDTSGIVYAAHSMVNGKVPDTNKDFCLIQIHDEEAVLDVVMKISQKFYDKRVNFQVLSPKHRGTVGVTNLNARLRELLNPASPGLAEMRLGKETVREGDRIMIIKNNYKLGVFNGDVGKVAQVDRTKKEVQIKIHGQPPLFVQVAFKDVPRLLVLAYACTIHKCVTGDTLISTSGGLITLSELASGHPPGTSPFDLTVAGRRGWTHMDQIFVGGVEPTFKLTTRLGYHIEGSHRHPVLVCTADGFLWKKLPQISEGDVLVLRRGIGNQVLVPMSTDAFTPDYGRGRIGTFPSEVGEDLARILGLLVGDGNYTDQEDGRVEFTQVRNPDFLVKVAMLCQRLFSVSPTIRERSFYFHGRLVRGFLHWCGLGYTKAPDKMVPWLILQSPQRVQAAFLQGLFDTDGGVSQLIHFTSSSRQLADGVHQLLLSLGIVSGLVPLSDSAYRVQVTGCEDKRQFQALVGFSIKAKQAKLEKLVSRATPSKSNVGLIPHGRKMITTLRHRLRERGGRNYPEAPVIGRLLSRTVQGAPFRVSHLPTLVQAIPDLRSMGPELTQIWEEGLFFDPVSKITEGEGQVFDLHVTDDEHAFVGNGFVNHNSQGLEYDRIVMPLVRGFYHQLQRNLLYTAITRAKKQVVLVGHYDALVTAVNNTKEDERATLFLDRLVGGLADVPSE